MKRILTIVLGILPLLFGSVPAWGQTPSTEGRDFWVTFLRADSEDSDDKSITLSLAFSSREDCSVTVENPAKPNSQRTYNVRAGQVLTDTYYSGTAKNYNRQNAANDCYSFQSETAEYTSLHITATKDISVFASNHKPASFDATNVLPSSACLDEYYVQTYPPSVHSDNSQGSHFAVIAVDDNVTVDIQLTAKTKNNVQPDSTITTTLQRGQVYYVWTGNGSGDAADFSGTHVKARNGKRIAVFQGAPHTCIPHQVRDRDHIFSQAMPVAFWGQDFILTSSLHHRRDIVRVMAVNDGTEVYLKKGEDDILLHTFDFSTDTKRTFEFDFGEVEAYTTKDPVGNVQPKGMLPAPLVADSSFHLHTSCPTGVHIFMVSNTYDEATPNRASGSISDPAMLWISPMEQVIKQITFATYSSATLHYVNIVTPTSNVPTMTMTNSYNQVNNISSAFRTVSGNPTYSYARMEIQDGTYTLKGTQGFLAHVYGFGTRESYAYSCGSSTVARSINVNGDPLEVDSVSDVHLCVDDTVQFKLHIGANTYSSILWDFGDGVTQLVDNGQDTASHKYIVPGWYDVLAHATYTNSCGSSAGTYTDTVMVSFRVQRPKTIRSKPGHLCLDEDEPMPAKAYQENGRWYAVDTTKYDCDSIVIRTVEYGRSSHYDMDTIAEEIFQLHGQTFTESSKPNQPYVITLPGANASGCDSIIYLTLKIVTCLDMHVSNNVGEHHVCPGEAFTVDYQITKGEMATARFVCTQLGIDTLLDGYNPATDGQFLLPTGELRPGQYNAEIRVHDDYCKRDTAYPLTLEVYYPTTVLIQKFDNELAVVLDPTLNGGYDFQNATYQWYKDELAIPGANNSIYYTPWFGEESLSAGEYYVLIKTQDGLTLPSCAQTITAVLSPNRAPALPQKRMEKQTIYIVREGQIYDLYGNFIRYEE